MSGRPPRDSAIREQAIENVIRERYGLDSLPPVTRLRVASLNSPASGSSDRVLPRESRARRSLIMTLPAALAGAVFATVVILVIPGGKIEPSAAEWKDPGDAQPALARPTTDVAERAHRGSVTERTQDGSESVGQEPTNHVIADPPEGPAIKVNGCTLTLGRGE